MTRLCPGCQERTATRVQGWEPQPTGAYQWFDGMLCESCAESLCQDTGLPGVYIIRNAVEAGCV